MARNLGTPLRIPNDRIIVDQHALFEHIRQRTPGRFQTVNLHHLQLADSNPLFNDLLHRADFITADGWPVALILRRNEPRVRRATGSALVAQILRSDDLSGRRWAIYGASAGAAAVFSRFLQNTNQVLVIAETGKWRDWDAATQAARCRDAGVESVLVALTQPATEIWGDRLSAHAPDLQVIGVGGGIEMATGDQRRAPEWIQALRAEWLYRLAADPQRLFRRYVLDGIPFMLSRLLPALLRSSARDAD